MALKWADIDWEASEIHIHRMESRVEDDNGKLRVAICEYTKKKSPAGDRYLPLSDYEINLFQMGILFSAIKKAEPRFARSITVSVRSVDVQESKWNLPMIFVER